MVENLPANAVDRGSIPDLGKIPHAVELLNSCATTTEPVLWARGDPQLLSPCVTTY